MSFKMKRWLKLDSLFKIFSLFTLFFLLIDSYGNPSTSQTYFFVDSKVVLISFLALCIFLRSNNYNFPFIITFINDYIIFPISSLLAFSFIVTEATNYEHYVFLTYRLNYGEVSILALFSLAFLLISKNHFWWSKNWKSIIFLSAIFLFIIFFAIRLLSMNLFFEIIREDSLVESAQFFTIFIASLVSFFCAKIFMQRNKFLAIIYFLLAIMFFFLAGEEISWGQRLIGFSTPADFSSRNLQDEFNVHNLDSFRSNTWLGYFLICEFGAFGWMLISLVPKRLKKIKFLIPPWFVSSYFLVAFLYYFLTSPSVQIFFPEWSEVVELFLYLGIFLFVLSTFINLKFIKDNSF